jgi:uncharacterized protein (TIGR02594 family)
MPGRVRKEIVRKIEITAYDLAARFTGLKEVKGDCDNPEIMAMLKLSNDWPRHDEVPWCGAFAGKIAWLLNLPYPVSLAARAWLLIGKKILLQDAVKGFDLVVFSRGDNPLGPEVINAPGHVAFFNALDGDLVRVLGGNQNDSVSVATYPTWRVLGVRRLFE